MKVVGGGVSAPGINLLPFADSLEEKLNASAKDSSSDPTIIRTFEPTSGFIFAAAPLEPNHSSQSMLSHLIGTTKMQTFNVLCKFVTPEVPLVVSVPELANFTQFLKIILRQYNKTSPTPVPETTDAYLLETNDNTTFHAKQIVGAMNKTPDAFHVKPNPKFLEGHSSVQAVLLQIYLPSGLYKTISVQPHLKMHVVLDIVCNKSRLDPDEHILKYLGKETSRDLTVGDISVGKALELEKKVSSENQNEVSGMEIYWYKKLAHRYTRYAVIIQKKGLKTRNRDLFIAIDGEHVVRSFVPAKKKQSKYNTIGDILFIGLEQSDTTGRSFNMAFKTDKDMCTYIAPTKDIAREIVGKIKYLLQDLR